MSAGLTALAGLRVVEMGVWVAAPAAAALLAEWGADVIKVEHTDEVLAELAGLPRRSGDTAGVTEAT